LAHNSHHRTDTANAPLIARSVSSSSPFDLDGDVDALAGNITNLIDDVRCEM
jgi:hypothetical protein